LYETYITETGEDKGHPEIRQGPFFKEKITKHNLLPRNWTHSKKNNLEKIAEKKKQQQYFN
jgi:hypothetical protein